jgi:hypothetical protein
VIGNCYSGGGKPQADPAAGVERRCRDNALCCRGCEYVAELISAQGFGRFSAGSRLPAGAILLSRTAATMEAGERWEDSLLAKLTAPAGADRGSPGLDKLLRIYLSIVRVLGVAAFGFALIDNLTTVAFSMAGKMSPLLAAILMPLNAMRQSSSWRRFPVRNHRTRVEFLRQVP